MRSSAGLATFLFVLLQLTSPVAAQVAPSAAAWGTFAVARPQVPPPDIRTDGHDGLNAQDTAPLAPRIVAPAPFGKVLLYSLELNLYIHVLRVTLQAHTRRELRAGPFWPDYFASVRVPKTWNDHDSWPANYIGHGIQGGASTRIWLDQREPIAQTAHQYLGQMGRAALFTTLASELFEFGPVSEASIGNVGLRRGRLGWVDHVWTPIGGMLWTMAEDAIDRHVRVPFERGRPTGFLTNALRVALNPSRAMANIGENRAPWARNERPAAR